MRHILHTARWLGLSTWDLARLGELLPQGAHFLEANRDVSHDGRHADHLACLVPKRNDRELERDASSILSDPWNGKNVAVAIPALAGLHDVTIAQPMARAQPLRNDDVQRLSDRVAARQAEDALGPRVLKADDAVLVGGNDRIGDRAQHGISQHRRRNHHRGDLCASRDHFATCRTRISDQ
jgi:hypothetical protein